MKSYAGIEYLLIHRKGKRCVHLESENFIWYANQGADMTLLDDIGRNGDPEEAIEAMLSSIPQKED